MLTPTGTWCEDAWIATAALSQATTRLKFLVAFRPGLISPTLVAQQAATFQRISGGRLLLNVVTGGDPVEQKRFGDHLDHDQRYERTGEFLEIVRGIARSGNSGRRSIRRATFHIEGARIDFANGPCRRFSSEGPVLPRRMSRRAMSTLSRLGREPGDEAARIAQMQELADATVASSASASAFTSSAATPRRTPGVKPSGSSRS